MLCEDKITGTRLRDLVLLAVTYALVLYDDRRSAKTNID